MTSALIRRKASVAIKLRQSVGKLRRGTLAEVLQASPSEETDGDRPIWSSQYPMSIVGYTEEKRAKSLDGGFFEDFVILGYKHDDQIHHAEEEAIKHEKAEGKASDVSLSVSASIEGKPLSKIEVENLYSDLLEIVINQLGKRVFGSDPITDGELFVYGQEFLGVSSEQHRRLYNLAKQKKPPDAFLKVTVKEAKNLEAKDANGFSDPYCMVAVIKAGEGDKPNKDGRKVKKIVLRDFPDQVCVRTTRIKPNTLNPVWDENFLLKVDSFQQDILRVDIWDKDDDTVFLDEDNRITSIKGFSGVGRFIKEVVQSTKCGETTMDDFLGIVEIPLKDVPSVGMDDWFKLLARSYKSQVQGQIHLKLEVLGSVDVDATSSKKHNSASLKARRQMCEQILLYDARKYMEENPEEIYWDCKMSRQAECILTQHAVQNGLSKFQLLVCEWEVMTKLQKDIPIQMDKFVELATRFKIYSNCTDLTAEEEKIFVNSMEKFVNYCYELLYKYRSLYPVSNPERCQRLGNMLLCLMILHKLPLFQNYFPEKRLLHDIEEALEISTRQWFQLNEAYFAPARQTPDEELDSLVSLTNTVNVDIGRFSNYSALFSAIGIDYYTFTFNQLESLVIQAVKDQVISLSQTIGYGIENDKAGTHMFELYIALRHMTEHKEKVPEELRKENGVEEYYRWFYTAVVKWLDLARQKAIVRVKKAVELDEEHVVHDTLKYSASAVDVTCCLGQICMFWKNLHWPEPSDGFSFVAKITDILSSVSMEYGKMMLVKLKAVGYYDVEGRFDISEKLCIAVNNLEHVVSFLDSIPSVLQFEDIIMEVCAMHGATREETTRSTLMQVLECAQSDLRDKLCKVVIRIGEKMSPDITNYLDQIAQKSRGKEDYEAVDPLLDYLDENLIVLNESLLDAVFQRMLKGFWKTLLSCIEEYAKKSVKSRRERFHILLGVIQQAREFFLADGQGLSEKSLHSSMSQGVEGLLVLYSSSSEEVIQKYYVEKCQEQANATEKFGALEFKVFYSQKNKALHVAVIHARNLLPMDSSGSSDPFVTLELLPKHLFPKQQSQKTSIKRSTLFPIYDENFSFEIAAMDCLQDGATLVLTVYDHDMVSDNDIAGEVFFDLNNVLGIEAEISGGFSCIQEAEMPLIHGAVLTTTFKILKERTDQKATSFVNSRQSKYRKMADDVVRGRRISGSFS